MTTTVNGTVALVGAGEYLQGMLPVDKKLLERVNGTPKSLSFQPPQHPTVKVSQNAGQVWVSNTLPNWV